MKKNLKTRTSCLLFAQYKIRVGCGARHFDRGMVSQEMFIWPHLIHSWLTAQGMQRH